MLLCVVSILTWIFHAIIVSFHVAGVTFSTNKYWSPQQWNGHMNDKRWMANWRTVFNIHLKAADCGSIIYLISKTCPDANWVNKHFKHCCSLFTIYNYTINLIHTVILDDPLFFIIILVSFKLATTVLRPPNQLIHVCMMHVIHDREWLEIKEIRFSCWIE